MSKHLLLLLILPLCCVAQKKVRLNDSLRERLRDDSLLIYRHTLAKPFLKIEKRNSFLFSHPVDFYGMMLGATMWNRHTFAVGYYLLSPRSKDPVPSKTVEGQTQQFLRFNYFNFTYQYVVLSRRYIQVNLPLEAGVGTFYARRIDSGIVIKSRHHNGRVLPFGGGIQLIGKIFPWMGLSAVGGYRFVESREEILQFDGLYYSYGLWVDVRQLLRDYKYLRSRKKYRRQQVAMNAK